MDRDDRGTRPMGGTFGINGVFLDAGWAPGTGARGTTTLSPQPAWAAGESDGWDREDDRHCSDLLLSRILRATSCTLERGLGTGTGCWPMALWVEGLGGCPGGGRVEHFWCSGFL